MSQDSYIKRNMITYLICLVIATILWFLNALNKEYPAEITYPIKYTDLPKDKMLISELPQKMTLEVKGQGFAILRHQISNSFLPIVFNVNSDILNNRDVLKQTILTARLKDKIQSQFSSGISLEHIRPDTIVFEFSRYLSNQIPVIPQLNYTLNKQFILKDSIRIEPAWVVVTGPASIIDTLQAVYTKPVNLKELSGDVSRTVALQKNNEVHTDITETTVSIAVERFTESKITVPLIVKNLPENLQIRLFPQQVDITFDIGLSRYDMVKDTSFIATVDYGQVSEFSTFIPVTIEKRPSSILNMICTPEKVEYLIEQK